jgi:hypothetical protein
LFFNEKASFSRDIDLKRGVHGHFHGKEPWCLMEELNKPIMAKLVGKHFETI